VSQIGGVALPFSRLFVKCQQVRGYETLTAVRVEEYLILQYFRGCGVLNPEAIETSCLFIKQK
jgi:hypothetical protein